MRIDRVGRMCLLPAVLVALAACSSGTAAYRPPREATDCKHMFSLGDASTGVGMDWDTDRHAYGDTVVLYVCDGAVVGVEADAPPRTAISPTRARVHSAALLRFRVTVHRGARGALHFTFRHASGEVFGDALLPRIVAEEDSWHFATSGI